MYWFALPCPIIMCVVYTVVGYFCQGNNFITSGHSGYRYLVTPIVHYDDMLVRIRCSAVL